MKSPQKRHGISGALVIGFATVIAVTLGVTGAFVYFTIRAADFLFTV